MRDYVEPLPNKHINLQTNPTESKLKKSYELIGPHKLI